MEKDQTNKNNTLDTFINGAVNGAINGALMLGIFSGLMLGASGLGLIGAYSVGSAVVTLAVGTLATSIFGGIASVRKESKDARTAERDARKEHLRVQELDQNVAITIPALATEPLQTGLMDSADKVSEWRDRVGSTRAADESFAKAIQEERANAPEQAASLA